MKISAGLILTDGERLLVGHATGQKHWDIPKGGIEPNESPLAACLREVSEETGLYVNGSIIDLGEFEYNSSKRLHLFMLVTSDLPGVEILRCTATFEDHNGETQPEFDGFTYIRFSDVDKYCAKNMARVLANVYGNLVNNYRS